MAGPSPADANPVDGTLCRNCGALAPGLYCPHCGQETKLRLPTLREFIREAAGRYVALDGRFWRTLVALTFRPGFLTREYIAGRRRRYIRPARLYLFATLIFFAASRLFIDPVSFLDVTAEADDRKSPARAASKSESKAHAAEDRIEFPIADNDDRALPHALRQRWDRFQRLPRSEKADQLVDGSLRYAPYAMFALLPMFAFLLKLAYLGRHRRYPGRPQLYGEHLVFAAHVHAFMFVAGTAMLLVRWTWLQSALWAWLIVYLVWALRAVYGGSWLGLLVRACCVVFAYTIFVSLATAGLVVIAAFAR